MINLIAAFLGGAGGGHPINMESGTYTNLGSVIITLQTDGDVGGSWLSAPVGTGDWHRGNPITGVGDDWEVRCGLASGGTGISGTFATWLPLTSSRTWTQSPVNTSEIYFEFRRAGGSTIIYTSGLITLDAQSI